LCGNSALRFYRTNPSRSPCLFHDDESRVRTSPALRTMMRTIILAALCLCLCVLVQGVVTSVSSTLKMQIQLPQSSHAEQPTQIQMPGMQIPLNPNTLNAINKISTVSNLSALPEDQEQAQEASLSLLNTTHLEDVDGVSACTPAFGLQSACLEVTITLTGALIGTIMCI
jgi:hypothetical protein